MDQGLLSLLRQLPALPEERRRKRIYIQHPDAVMMDIVPHPPVCHWRLGRHGFYGRMPAESRKHRIEAGIRHAFHTDSSVRPGILKQPFDSIIGVSRLVRFQPGGVSRLQRTDVLIRSLAQVSTPYTLKNNDIAIQGKHPHPRPEAARKLIPIRFQPIACTQQDDRVRKTVLGLIHGRMQPDPVPHRNIYLLLAIMCPKPSLGKMRHGLRRHRHQQDDTCRNDFPKHDQK